MAVTLVGTTSGSGSSGGGASVTVNKPSGVVAGDLLVILFGVNGGGTFTAATGFTLDYDTVADAHIAMMWKVADGSEGASFSVTHSAFIDGGWGCIAYRGTDTVAPILGRSATFSPGSATTAYTANSVSWTGAADAISLIEISWQNTSATVTYPAGWDNSPDGFSANDAFQWQDCGSNLTTSSAVTSLPSQSVTLSTAEFGDCIQWAFKVASAGPGPVQPSGRGLGAGNLMFRMHQPVGDPFAIPTGPPFIPGREAIYLQAVNRSSTT